MFRQLLKLIRKTSKDGEQTNQSRMQDIERAERAKRAAISQQAERLSAAVKAQNDAVLERLSGQHATLLQPRPPTSPRRNIKSALRGRKLCPLCNQNQRLEWEDDSLWTKELLGSQMPGRETSPTASVRTESSLSSVDTHTPTELRDIPLITSPVEVSIFRPAPPRGAAPPARRRRVSRLPVPITKTQGKGQRMVDGCSLPSATKMVEAALDSLERFHVTSNASTRPPAAAKKTSAVAPLAPKPGAKKTPAVTPLAPKPPTGPKPKTRGPRRGVVLRPTGVSGKKTASDCSPQTPTYKTVELQPLNNPMESLSHSFRLISDDDWEKKLDGLKTIRALTQHHSDTLRTKLHEVCLVVSEEVNNLRSVVACAAMTTLAELYVHLKKAMDAEVEGTGRALLLKLAQTTNVFIHQQANIALDTMVQNCSPGRIVSALLNTGLSHRCVAVRASTAQHLHMVADSLGAAHILTAGRTFSERFLTAVSTMSLDGAAEVRHHGQDMLQQLAGHKSFIGLWTKIVPEKDRRPLDKILLKTKH